MINKLSEKQMEILVMSAKGYKTEAIAVKLNVSPNTIKYHKKQIFQKLDVQSTIAAISYLQDY